jgi:hypothetical protein
MWYVPDMPAPIVPATMATSQIVQLLDWSKLKNYMYPPSAEPYPTDLRMIVDAMMAQLCTELDRRVPIPA